MTRVYQSLESSSKPIVVLVGGAGSSKSHSIAQWLIRKFCNESNKKFLVCRKTFPSTRVSCYELMLRLFQEYGIYGRLIHQKSFFTLYNPLNGSQIVFSSIDDPQKIKSTEWNYIWLAEADEFAWDDYIMCRLRLRAKSGDDQANRLVLDLNPSNPFGWVKEKLEGNPEAEFHFSTYLDNPFLPEDAIKVLLGLQQEDSALFEIYTLGRWAAMKGLIFPEWTILPELPPAVEYGHTLYSLDFGYTNPCALLEIGMKDGGHDLYLRELLYKTYLDNEELIARLKLLFPEEKRKTIIYADSAEPDRIAALKKAGFVNVIGWQKEEGSVYSSILEVKQRRVFYSKASENLDRERKSYKWALDKRGDPTEEPVKFRDHLMDCLRSGLWTWLAAQPKRGSVIRVRHPGDRKPRGMQQRLDEAMGDKAKQEFTAARDQQMAHQGPVIATRRHRRDGRA